MSLLILCSESNPPNIIDGPYETFDCASKGEIKQVMNYGVPGSKVVYSNPVKEVRIYYVLKKMEGKLTNY